MEKRSKEEGWEGGWFWHRGDRPLATGKLITDEHRRSETYDALQESCWLCWGMSELSATILKCETQTEAARTTIQQILSCHRAKQETRVLWEHTYSHAATLVTPEVTAWSTWEQRSHTTSKYFLQKSHVLFKHCVNREHLSCALS